MILDVAAAAATAAAAGKVDDEFDEYCKQEQSLHQHFVVEFKHSYIAPFSTH